MARRDRKLSGNLDLEMEKDFGLKSRVYTGLFSAAFLVVALGGWASTAELSGAVVAVGQVKVDKDLRSVQHLDGGIIREIGVKKGDIIKAGQTLFRLDETQTKAELQIVRSQLVELWAKQARLIAERDGLDYMPLVKDKFGLKVNGSDVLKGEARLFIGNVQTRSSQKKQTELTIAQLDEDMNGLQSQAKANAAELTLVEAEVAKVEDLFARKLVDGSRVYTSNRELSRLKGEKGNIVSNLAKSAARRDELLVNLKSIEETARTDAQKQLSEIEPRINELEQRHTAVLDRMARLDIRAPIGGTINEISVNTIGGVITPAQRLLTIVPEDAKLQVEVNLLTSDIDQVFVGQASKIRFSAFSARTTPELFGKVVFVSPATTQDEATGQVHYTAQIEIDAGEENKLAGKRLIPGMPVEAFVQTESRTAISYLAKPFTDQFTRAFREN